MIDIKKQRYICSFTIKVNDVLKDKVEVFNGNSKFDIENQLFKKYNISDIIDNYRKIPGIKSIRELYNGKDERV